MEEWDLEGAQRVDVVVERGVGVPGGEEAGAVGVDEGEGGGEVVVVVDEVGEVGHGFAAFVHGGREGGGCVGGRGRRVDGVDGCLPAGVFREQKRELEDESRAEIWGTYSGRYSATQSVFSFSVLAMMTTLSPAWPPEVGMFCTGPCSNLFFHECAI